MAKLHLPYYEEDGSITARCGTPGGAIAPLSILVTCLRCSDKWEYVDTDSGRIAIWRTLYTYNEGRVLIGRLRTFTGAPITEVSEDKRWIILNISDPSSPASMELYTSKRVVAEYICTFCKPGQITGLSTMDILIGT